MLVLSREFLIYLSMLVFSREFLIYPSMLKLGISMGE
jgi:hypothetical protein